MLLMLILPVQLSEKVNSQMTTNYQIYVNNSLNLFVGSPDL